MNTLPLSLPRFRLLFLLLATSFALTGLVVFRSLLMHNWFYFRCLSWNLFLAWIPIALALKAEQLAVRTRFPRFKMLVVAGMWGLFFPNAPYLITDVVHLHHAPGLPLWFDAAMLVGYALTGLLTGLLSLYWMHRLAAQRLGGRRATLLLTAYIPLSAWGVYLGRELRWNSWDIVFRPHYLLFDALTRGTNSKALLMTIEFSLLIGFSYLVLLALMHLNPRHD